VKPQAAATRCLTALLLGALGLVLTGCALPRMIDTDVQSFAGANAIPAGATYRFERLPSQMSSGTNQDSVEAIAETSLAKVGMVRNDAQARYSVQAELGVAQFYPEPRLPMIHERPWRGPNGRVVFAPRMQQLQLPDPPWTSYTVKLTLRELSTAQVAYETTASFQSPWSDGGNLVPIVMDAALQGFPTPPAGPRKVLTELIPR
jgi:hypothetical protein